MIRIEKRKLEKRWIEEMERSYKYFRKFFREANEIRKLYKPKTSIRRNEIMN